MRWVAYSRMDRAGVAFVSGQDRVGALRTDVADGPFRVAVRRGCRWRSGGHGDGFGGEHRVKGCGESGVWVTGEEPDRRGWVAEVHGRGAGLLRGAGCGGVFGAAGEVPPAGGGPILAGARIRRIVAAATRWSSPTGSP